MLWIPVVILPIAIAAAVTLLRRVGREYWVIVIAVVAIVEAALIGMRSPSFWELRHIAAAFALTILVPWMGAGLYVYLMPLPARTIRAVLGMPVLYFVLLGFGLLVGDMSGLIPQ